MGRQIFVPQLEEQFPFLDPIAFGYGQPGDLTAYAGGELGPAAGLDGSGAGVGHGPFHPPTGNRLDHHLQRIGAGEVTEAPHQSRQDENDDTPAKRFSPGMALWGRGNGIHLVTFDGFVKKPLKHLLCNGHQP
ncbi:hypothetical protein [Desulfosarcina cetonica]|uniref:hypothetical protein n=1 Tax=Desulfosarcina cetonica TaxID=90730 RepID=UPI001FEECD6E|nr:hypothetical protein [Desulfosarcina cetonica]